MNLMQIQEFTFCAHHKRGLIVLEDVACRLTLVFDIHPDEVPRLARMMKGSKQVAHPLHDFIQAFLEAFLVTPTDIILDDVPEKGLMAFVQVQRAGTMLSIPCYAPDALALATQHEDADLCHGARPCACRSSVARVGPPCERIRRRCSCLVSTD